MKKKWTLNSFTKKDISNNKTWRKPSEGRSQHDWVINNKGNYFQSIANNYHSNFQSYHPNNGPWGKLFYTFKF